MDSSNQTTITYYCYSNRARDKSLWVEANQTPPTDMVPNSHLPLCNSKTLVHNPPSADPCQHKLQPAIYQHKISHSLLDDPIWLINSRRYAGATRTTYRGGGHFCPTKPSQTTNHDNGYRSSMCLLSCYPKWVRQVNHHWYPRSYPHPLLIKPVTIKEGLSHNCDRYLYYALIRSMLQSVLR